MRNWFKNNLQIGVAAVFMAAVMACFMPLRPASAVSAPTVASVTPGSGSIAGGDSVTITGTGFVATPSVVIGGVSANNVAFVNSTTLTATTPVHMTGQAAVTVINPDGGNGSLLNGFTYLATTTVSSVSPPSGPVTGGTTVTINGTNFLPANTGGASGWVSTGKTLPVGMSNGNVAVVGNYMYLYAGTTIYRATTSDPTTWTNTGKTLPQSDTNAELAIIGNTMYFYGLGRVATIYSASVNDPTTWTSAGTMPQGVTMAQLAIVNGTMYMYGGLISGTYTKNIYTASTSNPTAWTAQAATIPVALGQSSLVQNGNSLYLIGGYNGTSYSGIIYKASLSDPLTWTSTGKSLPAGRSGAQTVQVGDTIYLYGGSNGSVATSIYTAPLSDPTTWSTSSYTLATYSYGSMAAVVGSNVYLYGGTASTTGIYAAPLAANRPNIYMLPWLTNWATAANDQPTATFGGTAATNVTVTSSSTATATIPAHAAGLVNVALTNFDASGTPLNNGFTYNPLPTVSGVTPNAGSLSGGDSVTITGSNFLATPTVTFGSLNSPQVSFINSNTIVATTPAHALGTVDVMVTNPDTGSVTAAGAFTYTTPPATISSIAPNVGLVTGGAGVTVTGTNFIGPNTGGGTGWTTSANVLPSVAAAGHTAVIGNYIYLYAGTTIMRAPVSNPTTWVNTGKTLPASDNVAELAVVGNTMYFYGLGSAATIYSASTSDPTTWTSTGKSLPVALTTAQLAVVGNTMYLFGGAVGTTYGNSIYTASTADPLTWTKSSKTLPVTEGYAGLVQFGGYLYILGGYNGSGSTFLSSIIRAPLSDPTTWTNTGRTVPLAIRQMQVAVVGDTMYMYGGYSSGGVVSTIYSASLSDPLTWVSTGGSLPATTYAQQLAIIDNNIYLFGGSGSTAIYSAPLTINRLNANMPPWTTNLQTVSSDQPMVTLGGTPATNVTWVNSTTVTATTPAHAAGVVDVFAGNYDGAGGTLSRGYTYDPLPTVASVTPNNASYAGGDSVTITGTNFVATPSVTFGGVPAASVQYVNSTTLVVTTPGHAQGTYDLTVTNPDTGAATLSGGFTFANPPPLVKGISPNNGAPGGGNSVTISGSAFLPKNTGGDTAWTTVTGKTLPGPVFGGQQAVVGNNIYIFGGTNGSTVLNTIYTATTADPTTWTNTGKTLPGPLTYSQLAVVGGYMYLFGGYTGSASTGVIYRATTADPTTWTLVSGKTLPTSLYGAQVAVVGNSLYLYGGIIGATYQSVIYTASTADPTTWTNTGKTLPTTLAYSQEATIGNTMYLYGGYTGSAYTNSIYTAAASDPTTWTISSKSLPAALDGQSLAVVGDYMYLYGGYNGSVPVNLIYRASLSDPLTWTGLPATLPKATWFSHMMVVEENIYLFGGQTSAGVSDNGIYTAPVQHFRGNMYNAPWETTWPLYTTDQSNVTIGGIQATNINFVSPTTITATVPAHAVGQANVTVTNYDGSSGTLTNGYTYNPPPTVTAVTPGSGVATGGDSVTITGANFIATPGVTFGGATATNVHFVNNTTITATTPAHEAGGVDVTVINPDGSPGILGGGFVYFNPPPTISTISPKVGSTAGGTPVTISGAHLINRYSVPLTLNNPGSSALTNYPVKVTIDTATPVANGKMRSDCGDLRFLDSDQQTVMGYWIESGCNTKTTQVWVNIPSLPVGSKTVYAVYGDGSLTLASNGNNVFDFFDDFSTQDSSKWSWTGSWTVTGGQAYNSYSGTATQTLNSVKAMNLPVTTTSGYAIGAYMRNNGAAAYYNSGMSATIGGTSYWLPWITTSAAYYSFFNYGCNGAGSCPSATTTNWNKYESTILGSQQKLFLNNSATASDTQSTALSGTNITGIAANFKGGGYVDYVYVRKIASSAPTVSVGSETIQAPTVTFDGLPATNVNGSSNGGSLTLLTPAHAAGVVDVVVNVPGYQTATVSGGFTYYVPPTIGAITPSSGPANGGTSVTITGSDFAATPAVTFGGVPATSVTFVDSNTITAVTPAYTPTSVDVVVTNPSGVSTTLPSGFTYLIPPPTITSLTPATGTTLGGTNVTINGAGFFQQYSRPVAVTNDGTSDLSSYPVQVVLDTATPISQGKLKNDCSNLRFTAADQSTQLSYWIESGCNTTGTRAWVKIPVIPVGGTTIYAVYGNPNLASAANGNAVFDFFDDFSTKDTTKWNWPGSWSVSGGLATVNAASGWQTLPLAQPLSLQVGAANGYAIAASLNNSGASANYDVVLRATIDGTNYAAPDITSLANVYTFFDHACSGGCPTTTTSSRHRIETTIFNGQQTGTVDYAAPFDTRNVSFLAGNITTGSVGFYAGGSVDYYYIHKVVANAPTTSVGSESLVQPTVFFGDAQATITNVSGTSITVTTPAHKMGGVDVSVANPGGVAAILPSGFSFLPKKLVITSPALNVREGQPGQIIIAAEDDNGNPVLMTSDTTVQLSTSSSTGFFASSLTEDPSTQWNYTTVTIPSGYNMAAFYYKDNAKGTPTVRVTMPLAGGPGGDSQIEQITSKYRLLVTGVTNPVKSGVPSSVTIQAVDYNGQPLHDYTGTVHFTSTDAAAQLPADFALPPSYLSGNTFTNGVTMITQGTWCVTATDTVDPDITGSQCNVVVDAPGQGTISQLAIITPPYVFAATSQSGAITVQAQDSNGSPVPVTADKPIYLYSDSATGQFSFDGSTWQNAPVTAIIRAGATSTTFYYRDSTVGQHHITARDDQGTGSDFGWTNATQTETTGVGSVYRLKITPPVNLAAGQTGVMHISQQDALGNDVPGLSAQTVYLTTNSGNTLLSYTGDWSQGWVSTAHLTIPAGVTGVDLYMKNSVIGSYTATASDAMPADGALGLLDDTEPFSIVGGVPAQISFITPPFQLVAGAASQPVTVGLRDQGGNLALAAQDTSIYLSASTPGAVFYDMNGNVITSVTVPAGQSTANFTMKQMLYTPTQTLTATDNPNGPDGAAGLADDTQTETITTGGGAQLKITTPAPPPTVAGTSIGPITVALFNQYGIEVPSTGATPIYLRSSSTGGSFSLDNSSWSGAVSTSLADGQSELNFYYQDTLVGDATITAADEISGNDTGLTDATQTITTLPGPPGRVSIVSTAQTTQAGQPSTAVTVRLEDRYGNALTAAQDTLLTLTSNSPTMKFDTAATGNFDGSVTSVNLAAGKQTTTFFYRGVVAGTPQISVASSGLTGGTQTETVIWGAITKITLSGASTAVAGHASGALTITTFNAYGIVVPTAGQLAITVTSGSANGRFDIDPAGSFDGSVTHVTLAPGYSSVNFYYKDTTVGSYTITTSAGTIQATTPMAITPDVPAKLAITNAPLNLQIGQQGRLTLVTQDIYGNLSAVSSDLIVNLTSTSSNSKFTSSNTGGPAITSVTIRSTSSAATFYYTDLLPGGPAVSVSANGLIGDSQVETVVYGPPAGLTMSTTNYTLTAGQVSGPITVSPINAFYQIVPATADLTIVPRTSSTGGSFDLTGSGSFTTNVFTLPAGSMSAIFYYKDTVKGSPTLTATPTNPGVAAVSMTLNIAAGAPFKLYFLNGCTTTAGTPCGPIYATLADQYGNAVLASSALPISLSSSEPTAGLSLSNGGPWPNPANVSIPAGMSNVGFYYHDTVAGNKTITVSSTGLVGASMPATVNPAAMSRLAFSTGPQTIVAKTISGPITIVGYDQYNNQRSLAYAPNTWHMVNGVWSLAPTPQSLTISLGTGSSGGTFSILNSPWATTNTVTIPYDTPSQTFYYQDTVIGSTVLTVQDSNLAYAPISQPITVTAGNVAAVKFTSPVQTVVTNTPSQPISVALTDANGYPNADSQDHTVHLASSSPTGQFSLDGDTWTTSADLSYPAGTITQQIYYRDSTAGTFTMTASSSGLASDNQMIVIVPGTIAQLSISADPAVTAGQWANVSVQTSTASGQPAAVGVDTTIPLTSATGGKFSLTKGGPVVTTVTLKAGHYSAALFYTNTTAGVDTLTAAAPNGSGWSNGTTTITVNSSVVTKYVYLSFPGLTTVGAPSAPIVVQAEDQYGNAVLAGQDTTVYLYGAATGEFASDPSGPWTATTAVISAGNSVATFYYQDTLPGTKTITVSDATSLDSPDTGITNAVKVMAITSLRPTQLKFTTAPQTLTAGQKSGVITIEADQANGQKAVLGTNFVVTLSSSDSRGNFYDPSSDVIPINTVTIPAGASTADVYYRTNAAGTWLLTASNQTVTSDSQNIIINADAPSKLVFLTAAQTKAAGVDSDQMRVQLQDQYGNAAPAAADLPVLLLTDGSTGSFSARSGASWNPITAATIAKGSSDLYFYYHETQTGISLLSVGPASTASNIGPANQKFTVTAGPAIKVAFVNAPTNLTAGQASGAISASLQDQYGNNVITPVTLSVTLATTSSGGQFASDATFTAPVTSVNILGGSSQSAAFYYKDTEAGTSTITAASGGLVSATQDIAIDAGTPDHLSVTGNQNTSAGETVPLLIHLENYYGAEIASPSNLTLYLRTTSAGGRFSADSTFTSTIATVVLTAGSKNVNVYYQDTVAGTATVTAADQASGSDVGLTDGSIQITVLPGNVARLGFLTPPLNQEAGQPSAPLTVQTQDMYGNAVIVPSDVTVYLSSSSTAASFSTSGSFGTTITQIVISAGTGTATFYYKDMAAGSPVITAADQPSGSDTGLADAAQTETILAGTVSKLVWTTNPSLEAGEVATLTVQSQNRWGAPTPVTADTKLYLTHTGTNSGFSTSNGGPWTLGTVTLPAGQHDVSMYYRSNSPVTDTLTAADTSPAIPDVGLTNAVMTVNVTAGVPSQLVFTSPSYSIIARHTSKPMIVTVLNAHGAPTNVTADTQLYLRTTSADGQFAASTGGPWGISYITLPAGQNNSTFYYEDPDLGSPLITVADNLPPTPDTGLINATQTENIVVQTVDHLLVTNISTPQTQGSPSSIVVEAQDVDNYIVSDYAGTISFSSSDADAVLPHSYTFNPDVDKGIHTFTNGAAFLHPGIKSVTATDTNGLTGTQYPIIVNGNTAGPIKSLQFTGFQPPLGINVNTASQPITVQSVDANNQPSNAPAGGYPVHLTSTSPTGQFALDPAGPWSAKLDATIPAYLNSVNVYYRDSQTGQATLTAQDWINGVDDPNINNATTQVQIRSLQITMNNNLQVNNNSHYYVSSPIIFSKNSNGDYYAQEDFGTTVTDQSSGAPIKANLTYTLKDADGNVFATQTASNTSSYTYHVQPISGTMKLGKWTLDVTATDPVSGISGTAHVDIPLSGWVIQVTYDPNNKKLGVPLPYNVSTFYNGQLADPYNFFVNFRDDNGDDVTSATTQQMANLTHTGVGQFAGSIPTTGLQATNSQFSNAYYLYIHSVDNTGQLQAEDNHYDIFFQNNPALAPKNFQIEKIVTSTPGTSETYNLKFSWNASDGASDYILYRSQNKNATLYGDPCTILQVQTGHRYSDPTSRTPFCETQGQQNVGTDDTQQWVQEAQVNAPATSVTLPWSQLQADLPNSTYYYLVRAENSAGQAGYSTMAVSVKRHFTTNVAPLTNINWVALPYFNGNYTDTLLSTQPITHASDIVKDVEGGTGNGSNKKINRVAIWTPDSQIASTAYTYNTVLRKWAGNDFTIVPGNSVYLQPTGVGGFDWTLVGSDVANSLTITPNPTPLTSINWLSIPYTGMYKSASDIVADIEGSTVGSAGNDKNRYINRVALWTSGTQTASSYYSYNTILHKWTGTNFTINPGDGVYIQSSGGGLPLSWTLPLIINPYN